MTGPLPSLYRVDTANANDAGEGGDTWEWDGEEDRGDIEMPSVSASSAIGSTGNPPVDTSVRVARGLSESSGALGMGGGALGHHQGESIEGFSMSSQPPRQGLVFGGAGESSTARTVPPARGGGRGGGRGRKQNAGSRGKQTEGASGILPNDDLFAVCV